MCSEDGEVRSSTVKDNRSGCVLRTGMSEVRRLRITEVYCSEGREPKVRGLLS
ncbi:hypothetical protein RchiOBHm_Chr6g0262631 [Rosa chinensis]|uniref:Uncharacterized protein n=1 Tax=Rosa chinensis TaxID=74649 RepID=A0A2P6PNR0_ROSCH|nr:hypothetical protein RchiOBHm_Chr6g0262631 [Rosa chinensis]